MITCWLHRLLHWLFLRNEPVAAPPFHPRWLIQVRGFAIHLTLYGDTTMLELKTGQKASVRLDPEDDRNNIVSVDGAINFTSDDSNVFTVASHDDGFGCDVIATVGGEGKTANLRATFDADRGAGVNTITEVLSITVSAREATHGVFVIDGPVDVVPAP